MPRIRVVKPEAFKHEGLYECELRSRLPVRWAFVGLWTVADKQGRFRWRPRVLKTDVLPFDDVDFVAVLDALAAYGFVERYEVGGEEYGWIPSFLKHQRPHSREAISVIPPPPPNADKVSGTTKVVPRHDLGSTDLHGLPPVSGMGIGNGEQSGTGGDGVVGEGNPDPERGAAPAPSGGPPAPERRGIGFGPKWPEIGANLDPSNVFASALRSLPAPIPGVLNEEEWLAAKAKAGA